MTVDLQRAGTALTRFLNAHDWEALVAARDFLTKIGSLEQAANEAQLRVDKALARETDLKNSIAALDEQLAARKRDEATKADALSAREQAIAGREQRHEEEVARALADLADSHAAHLDEIARLKADHEVNLAAFSAAVEAHEADIAKREKEAADHLSAAKDVREQLEQRLAKLQSAARAAGADV